MGAFSMSFAPRPHTEQWASSAKGQLDVMRTSGGMPWWNSFLEEEGVKPAKKTAADAKPPAPTPPSGDDTLGLYADAFGGPDNATSDIKTMQPVMMSRFI